MLYTYVCVCVCVYVCVCEYQIIREISNIQCIPAATNTKTMRLTCLEFQIMSTELNNAQGSQAEQYSDGI